MKPKLFALFIFFIVACNFTSFSQTRDAGGSASANCTVQPEPDFFRRNNGNGTCGTSAQIQLIFSNFPTEAPVLTGLYYQIDGSPITCVSVPVYGDMSELQSKGYINYCLNGCNLPPVGKITVVLRYPNGCQRDVVLNG